MLQNSKLLGCIVLFFLACNPSPKTNTETTADTTMQAATVPTKLGIGEGVLDILVADSASFAALQDNKLVFTFTFVKPDSLTIHGWNFKGIIGQQFDSLPTIKLGNTGVTEGNNTYYTETYFGNLVLKNVNKIQKMLRDSSCRYVLFVPGKLGNNIKYDIRITKELPYKPLSADKFAVTGFTANPSPPKND